ncbi:DUF3617 domain-containing protein [Sphingomonas immobilis]|uniref:DUF3617 domain-containing protein n=1 Tax=Sphingomonas immobilis TaxID=3063997 RepID=A0ABT9A2H3_9SPHN|nr:DUF3617 domain-containing protein [Sphingomonas sp. CA1-15]MDO7844034.1 DUF3617 domain-containing protein [Sphingomonas sp. CA1-15]
MRNLLLAAAAALPLAACGSGGPTVSATNASSAEVAAKMDAATGGGDMIRAGRWEGTAKVDMKIPNLPPAAQAQMASKMAEPQKVVSCVTPEQVKEKKALFTGDRDDKNCKYDSFTMGGGKIAAKMTCNHGDGEGPMVATLSGSYTPDSYQMSMNSSTPGAKGLGAQSMSMEITAKRTGECKGTEDKE